MEETKKSAMSNTLALSSKQYAFIDYLRAKNPDRTTYSRTELTAAYNQHAGFVCSPSFLTKNNAYKARDEKGEVIRGLYDISLGDVYRKEQEEKKKTAAEDSVVADGTEETASTTESAPEAPLVVAAAGKKSKKKKEKTNSKPHDPIPEVLPEPMESSDHHIDTMMMDEEDPFNDIM